jgi:hypothetical protein
MTPDERLTRIRSLERKVFDLEARLVWAEREREGTLQWGQSAFAENRRLTDRLGQLIDRIPVVIEADDDGPCRYCGGTGNARRRA